MPPSLPAAKRFHAGQDAITPLWSATAGGCHPNRDTTTTITDAGFDIDTIDRFAFSPTRYAPGMAHIIGRTNRDGYHRQPAGHHSG